MQVRTMGCWDGSLPGAPPHAKNLRDLASSVPPCCHLSPRLSAFIFV